MDVSSHEDSAGEICSAGSIFSIKLLGFMSKAIKLLLTVFVGQCSVSAVIAQGLETNGISSNTAIRCNNNNGSFIFIYAHFQSFLHHV